MGRYYSGDIEGKFWFAVQSSTDASFFGGEEIEPNYINYYFDKEDIKDIERGIKTCKKELGDNLGKLDKFFDKKDYYNDEEIEKALKLSEEEVKEMLKWYARLQLGEKILNCVEKQGECNFEAEI